MENIYENVQIWKKQKQGLPRIVELFANVKRFVILKVKPLSGHLNRWCIFWILFKLKFISVEWN